MNSFGRIFRMTIFGESHGTGGGIGVGWLSCWILTDVEDFIQTSKEEKVEYKKALRQAQESDLPIFKTGIFNDRTTGAPITILFENNNTRSGDYEKLRAIPRPGHADFVAHEKFGGYEDYRGGGHFSGRLTVALVAAGVIAKKLLHTVQTEIRAEIKEIAGMEDLEAGLQKAIDAKDSVGGIVECRVQNLAAFTRRTLF